MLFCLSWFFHVILLFERWLNKFELWFLNSQCETKSSFSSANQWLHRQPNWIQIENEVHWLFQWHWNASISKGLHKKYTTARNVRNFTIHNQRHKRIITKKLWLWKKNTKLRSTYSMNILFLHIFQLKKR